MKPSQLPHLLPPEFDSEVCTLEAWLKERGVLLPPFAVQRLLLDINGAQTQELVRSRTYRS